MVLRLLPWALLLSPLAARAEAPPPLPRFVRLEYIHPAGKGCPEQAVLEDAVLVAARRDPFNRVAPALLRVTIAPHGHLYAATLEVRDGDGGVIWTRPFDPLSSCGSAVQAAGFLMGSLLRDPPPAPAPSPAPVPPPAPAVPLKREAPAPPRSEPLRLNLGIASALAIRTTAPEAGFNLVADAGLRVRSFSIAGEFRWTPPEVADVDTAGLARVHVMQFSGGVVPCGHFRALFYCGVGQVIAVVGMGAPGVDPRSVTTPSAATGTRIGVELPLPVWGRRFAVRLSADVVVTLLDVAFHFGDPMEANAMSTPPAWTSPRLVLGFGAGFKTDLHLK